MDMVLYWTGCGCGLVYITVMSPCDLFFFVWTYDVITEVHKESSSILVLVKGLSASSCFFFI